MFYSQIKSFFNKIRKWEYWPLSYFYMPIYIYYLLLSLKARTMFFFTASNPLMELGGLRNYSKANILKTIDDAYLPKTVYLESEEDRKQVLELLKNAEISFPFVAKPDMGERGNGVRKIDDKDALSTYLQNVSGLIILQEFIEYPLELGVLYYRYPNESSGHVSSVVKKDFLTVTGDGKSTIRQLMEKHERGHLYINNIINIYPQLIDKQPKMGEKVLLEPIGNHSRGTAFLDANHLINDDLVKVFDKISQSIEGFSFGRYDFKVSSLESLYAGKDIKILELNGANSEPAHIYDPQNSLWRAYRDLFKHWAILYRVSTRNHKELGIPYTSWEKGWEIFYAHRKKA